MKLSALQHRIVLAAGASSLVAVLLVWAAGSAAFHRVTAEMDRQVIGTADQSLCERAPELWSKELGSFFAAFAYDAATGVSVNPAAPPLDEALRARATVLGAPVDDGGHFGRTIAVKLADSGLCSYFEARFRPPPGRAIHEHAAFIALGGVAAMMAVAGLTVLLAVRPILRRVRRLRDAAGLVGQEGYAPARDPTGDELTRIAEVLDASDARIRADREELLARQEALERHLCEIAHDLRTPLASLLLVAEELSEGAPAEQRPLAARALEDTVYLEALVDNLRQAALLRHGLDPRAGDGQADLGEVVRRVGARFAALGRRRDVEVAWAVPDAPVTVRCAPALAERALANLVHNAVIHGHPGGHVAVTLEVHGARFTLAVLDDGPGVPPERLPDLSAASFHDDPARPRGQGLGLAITNEIARRAGWAVRYGAMEAGGLGVQIEGDAADG